MQKRPKGWETARDDPNHIGELLVTIDGKQYAAQDIVSCEIERNLLENTAEVGNATAAVLTLEINQREAIPKRAKVVVQYRLALDDARTDYIPKGTYWINTREKDGRYLKLTCYDAMLMAQQDYLGDVTADDWPQQETACVAEIAQRIGVEIDPRTQIGTGDNHQVSMPVGRTMREVLEQIAAANGGNWCITPAGKLLLVPFAGTGDVLPAVSGAPDCGDVQAITGVRVVRNDTDTPLLAGDETGTVLEVENENGTQALADELAQKLVGLPYAPYTCNQRYIDPVAEAGDSITVGGAACIIYNSKESLGPSHYADLEAPEEAGELEEEYPYQTTAERVKKQIGTVTASVAEIRKDQQSIEAEVSKTTETVAKNTQDIEAARKEATEKSEAAAAAAKQYADDKLIEYSTTEEVKSLVSQTAENITSEVSKTYATTALVEKTGKDAQDAANNYTDGQLVRYSTTEETKSLIDQRADGITQEVSKTYATKSEMVDAKDSAAEDATSKANQALDDAKSYTAGQLKSYSTTEETKSLIDQKADSITLDVKKSVTETVTKDVDGKLENYSTKSETESAINVALDGIKLGIKSDDVWTDGSFGDETWKSLVKTTVADGVLTVTATSGYYAGGTLYIPAEVRALLGGKKVSVTYEYKVTQELSGANCGFIYRLEYQTESADYKYGTVWATSSSEKAAGDWTAGAFTFTAKADTITEMYFNPRLDNGASGQIMIRNVTFRFVSGVDNSFQLTKDGATLSTAKLNTSDYASRTDLTMLQLNYDSLQATVVKDGQVRSKFAMDTSSVTISSGVITFSGDTLVVDSENFKLKSDGTVAITGTFTSEKDYDRAYIGDGEMALYKKIGSDWLPAVRVYSDGADGSYLLGHVTVYGDKGADDKRIDMYTDQAGAKLDMLSADGTKFIKMYANGDGEGRLEIGGVNGLGELECKYIKVDGQRLQLMDVNYQNKNGKPVHQYFLAGAGGEL